MAGTDFSDDLLMRFVDGEVDAAAAMRVEAAMRNDSDLADRVAVFAKTRTLARDALDPLLKEPVPTALVRSVEGMIERHRQGRKPSDAPDNLVALSSRRTPRSGVRHWAVPLAASIAAVIAGVGGFWLGVHNSPQKQMLTLGIIDDPALVKALANVPSGREAQIPALGEVRVVSSFRDGSDEFCRELEITTRTGLAQSFVACHKQSAWTTTFAVAIPANGDSYAPASSSAALDAYLSSIDATQPMTIAAEKQALEQAK